MQKETKIKGAVVIGFLSIFIIGYLILCQYQSNKISSGRSVIKETDKSSEILLEDTWKLYKQDDFSFFLPSDWKQGNLKEILVSQKDSSDKLLIDIQKIEDINNQRGLRTLAQQENLKEYERLLCVGLGNVVCPEPMLELQDFYIEGGKGIKYVRTSKSQEGTQEIRRVSIVKNNKVYEFWFQDNDSEIDDDSAQLFDTIMRTLKID